MFFLFIIYSFYFQIVFLKNPGTDQRHNVNIVARPPKHIQELVKTIQDELRKLDPHQYYYRYNLV